MLKRLFSSGKLLEKLGLAYAIKEETLHIPSAITGDDEEKNSLIPALGEQHVVRLEVSNI
jgi:hypothetical protein